MLRKVTPQQIELINPKDQTPFVVKFLYLSGNRYSQILDIIGQYRDTKKEANILFMMAQSDPAVLTKQFEENDAIKPFKLIVDQIIQGKMTVNDVALLFEQSSPEIYKENFIRNIDIIKIMIDKKSLTEEQQALLEDQEFWYEQDVITVEEVANSFRDLSRV